MKKMTLQVGEATFNRIAKNPRLVKQWILQVIHKFPGLLDDLTDDTLEFMDTNNGPIRILQPTTSQNPQPLDQQDHVPPLLSNNNKKIMILLLSLALLLLVLFHLKTLILMTV